MPLFFWFDLFLEARAEILKGFLVKTMASKRLFEINWPLQLWTEKVDIRNFSYRQNRIPQKVWKTFVFWWTFSKESSKIGIQGWTQRAEFSWFSGQNFLRVQCSTTFLLKTFWALQYMKCSFWSEKQMNTEFFKNVSKISTKKWLKSATQYSQQ